MMKFQNTYYTFWENMNRNLEQRKEQDRNDLQRRRMLMVNPGARLATVFGATFSM